VELGDAWNWGTGSSPEALGRAESEGEPDRDEMKGQDTYWSNTRFAGNPVASEGWSIQSSLGAVFVNAFGHAGKGELRGCYETRSSSASERLEWISDEKTSRY
jgi:hypothetical protein